jgi:hypothetical protein
MVDQMQTEERERAGADRQRIIIRLYLKLWSEAKMEPFPLGRKTSCTLIATANEDNANRRQMKGKKLNYKLLVILMQKGIVFIFANYLDNVLV